MTRTLSLSALLCFAVSSFAADEEGFRPLFNGKDLTGWMNPAGKDSTWKVVDGSLTRTKGAGNIFTKERFGDFVLKLEFKTAGNSGILLRCDNPKSYVQTCIEVQVDNPNKPGKHSVGALYDLVAPSKNVAKKGDWNAVTVTCKGSMITVEMNGEKINEMNLDEWTEGNKNPDGSRNKFKTALKDFKREGHIGVQDHGADVMYRNVMIKTLD